MNMAQSSEIRPKKFSDLVKSCVKMKDRDKLMEVLHNHPTLHPSERKSIKAIASKSAKNQHITKILQVYLQEGIGQAERYYQQQNKVANQVQQSVLNQTMSYKKESDIIATDEDKHVQGHSFAKTYSYTAALDQQSIQEHKKEEIDETLDRTANEQAEEEVESDAESVYEEIDPDDVKERPVVSCVNSVEEQTTEIKRGVQQVNVAIDNSFSDLKSIIEQMSRKTAMDMEQMKKQMLQMQQTVLDLQDEMHRHTNAINTGVSQLLQDTDKLRSNVKQGEEFNEYIYYLVFTMVSRAIGMRKGRWVELFVNLVDGFPDVFIRYILWEIQAKHPSEVDMTYDCLTRWKVYDNSKERLTVLTQTLTKMGFNHVVKDINQTLKEYKSETENNQIADTVTDEVLVHLSRDLDSEYLSVSEYLDIGPTKRAELEEIYADNQQERNYAMLKEWRDNQESYTSTALAKLAGALQYCDRSDLVESLSEGVRDYITLAPALQDDYLTASSLSLP